MGYELGTEGSSHIPIFPESLCLKHFCLLPVTSAASLRGRAQGRGGCGEPQGPGEERGGTGRTWACGLSHAAVGFLKSVFYLVRCFPKPTCF